MSIKYIKRKSLLYKSGVEYTDYCINHIEGCAHGCKFPCYAMMLKKRCGIIRNYQEWLQPKIVSNALELLEKELPKYKSKINFVQLCLSTDPFMYKYPQIEELSLRIIERLNKDNIKCVVLTKGIYPKFLINEKKYSNINEYGITVVSLNKVFKKRYEPYSALYEDRIKSLKYLHDNGLKTWISMEPYPTPNLIKQNILEILKRVSFVDKIIFGRLNYNIDVSKFICKKDFDFYEKCSDVVISFCKENSIDYHIKLGTTKVGNRKTESIFYRDLIKELQLT